MNKKDILNSNNEYVFGDYLITYFEEIKTYELSLNNERIADFKNLGNLKKYLNNYEKIRSGKVEFPFDKKEKKNEVFNTKNRRRNKKWGKICLWLFFSFF